jgi:YgiT-type zinc finger domain-containing protein
MKCVICNQAEVVPGVTSVSLQRGESSLLVNNVPVQLCPNCGEAYADEMVTSRLLREGEKLVRAGTKADVREYAVEGQ